MDKRLLEIRNKLKKKKPKFIRQDAHKKAKLDAVWRRPRGSDSKMRRKLRGYRRSVEIGWGSPKKVKHLHRSGLQQILVHNVEELARIDQAKQGILIAGAVGTRNRVAIVKEALQKNITILNIKNPNQFLQEVESEMKAKSEEKKEREKQKDKKEKEKEQKREKEKEEAKEESKDELAKKLEEEEKKKKEKEEKDKILTKPEK